MGYIYRWEYEILDNCTPTDFIRLGNEGWQLVAVVPEVYDTGSTHHTLVSSKFYFARDVFIDTEVASTS